MRKTAESTAATHAATQEVQRATARVEEATIGVQSQVDRLAAETTRTQRLAIWVGVATGILGAILGGVAGAFAAKAIGS